MSLTQPIVNDSAQPALGAPTQASALQRDSILKNQLMAYGTYSQPQISYIQNVCVVAHTGSPPPATTQVSRRLCPRTKTGAASKVKRDSNP